MGLPAHEYFTILSFRSYSRLLGTPDCLWSTLRGLHDFAKMLLQMLIMSDNGSGDFTSIKGLEPWG